MKKKVLFVVQRMDVGGVEKSLLTYLNRLPAEKYDITVGLVDRVGPFLDRIPSHVKVVEIASLHDNAWRWRTDPGLFREIVKRRKFGALFMIPYLRVVAKIRRTLIPLYSHYVNSTTDNQPEYDVAVSFQGPSQILDYYVGKVVKARKKIGWIHFDVDKFYFNAVTTAAVYRDFSKVYAVSDEASDAFRRRMPTLAARTETLLNIIDWEDNLKQAEEFVPYNRNRDALRRIVTVGRIRYEKGQDIAVRAAEILRKQGYRFKWTMVGDGFELDNYRKIATDLGVDDCVEFAGNQVNPYPYMKHADIYVQPSRTEGFCLTIGEAKVFGLPIVATGFQGAREQLTGVENAVIVDSATPEAIAEGIKKVWDMPRIEFKAPEVSEQVVRLMRELDS